MTASITLQNLTLDYPIYGITSRSIRNTLIKSATGGRVSHTDKERVAIRALDHINLDIKEGDRIGLMGHNGSGKSTLLKVIAGVYEPSAGSCEVNGKVASMLNFLLGMHSDSTGLENIIFRGKLLGLTRAEINNVMDEIIAFSELSEYIHMPYRTYSSGMCMRLGFAISTAIKSDILLMDEWITVGDAAFKEKADLKLKEVLSTTKILILASHDESTILKNCNKIIRLNKGVIASIETV